MKRKINFNGDNSIWKPMRLKPMKYKSPFKIRPVQISPVKLSIYPSRTKKEWRVIDRKPYADSDRDGVMNWFDCKPLNRKKHSKMLREEISHRLYNQPYKDYKKTKQVILEHLNKYGKKKGLGKFNPSMAKIITEKNVIKHFEKHPEQLADAEHIDWATMTMANSLKTHTGKGLVMGRYEPPQDKKGKVIYNNGEKSTILLAPALPNDEDTGKVITHELEHYKQFKRHEYHSSLGSPSLKNLKKYKEDSGEIEAHKVADNLKRLKFEESPETLQSLEPTVQEPLAEYEEASVEPEGDYNDN